MPLRISRRILAPVLIASAVVAIPASPRPSTAAAVQSARPIDAGDLVLYRSVVGVASHPIEVRRVAATRLLQHGGPEDWAMLCGSDPAGGPLPFAVLFAGVAESDPALLEAMAAAAGGLAPAPAGEAIACLAAMLAMSGPSGESAMSALLGDASRPIAERIGAARLLGGVGSVAAIASLVALLESEGPEAPLREATVASLRGQSGRGWGDDPVAWRRWFLEWSQQVDGPSCEVLVEELAAKVERAERDRQRVSERADRIGEKLRAAHAAILLGLDLPRRQEHLRQLLADDLEMLRIFSLEQFERMLRDGDQIPEETVARVLERLGDPSAAVRVRAAKLLAQLGGAAVPRAASERLVEEIDPAVVQEFLRLLAERPTEGSFPALLARLPDPAFTDAAARALARLDAAGLMPVDWRRRTVEAVRLQVGDAASPSPPLVRLWALSGDESDRDRLLSLLASEDPARRRAVAEAWARRGMLEPLLERSGDAAVFPALAAGLVEHRPNLDGLALLLGLTPAEGAAAEMQAAMARMMQSIPLAELLAADDLLAAVPTAPPAWRLETTRRVAAATAAELSPGDREELLHRHAGLMLSQGKATAVADLLDAESLLRGQRLHGVLFRARVLSGRYEQAATQFPSASPWLDLLVELRSVDETAAAAVAAEIDRRFAASMSDAERARWETLSSKASPPAPQPSPPPSSAPSLPPSSPPASPPSPPPSAPPAPETPPPAAP